MRRKAPVSPGTATFAIVPYINAHNPRAAIYRRQLLPSDLRSTGKAVAVPVSVNIIVFEKITSRCGEVFSCSIQSGVKSFRVRRQGDHRCTSTAAQASKPHVRGQK